MNGQDLSFDVQDKSVNGYLAIPEQTPAPGVIVLHAWWGLNEFFKNLCDRLAAEGFVAFAPDMNKGKVAHTVDEAKEIMSELSYEGKHAVVDALVDFMRGRPEVRNEPLSLIGFSMGAAWSLVLASDRPQDIGKVVLFYGTQGMDFAPIQAEILGHFSDADEWEPIDDVRSMESSMKTIGLKTNFHTYPNVSHWFFEEDRPEFDPQAAEVAWKRTVEFLRK
jgi:carboxymethylenebutenolidase